MEEESLGFGEAVAAPVKDASPPEQTQRHGDLAGDAPSTQFRCQAIHPRLETVNTDSRSA